MNKILINLCALFLLLKVNAMEDRSDEKKEFQKELLMQSVCKNLDVIEERCEIFKNIFDIFVAPKIGNYLLTHDDLDNEQGSVFSKIFPNEKEISAQQRIEKVKFYYQQIFNFMINSMQDPAIELSKSIKISKDLNVNFKNYFKTLNKMFTYNMISKKVWEHGIKITYFTSLYEDGKLIKSMENLKANDIRKDNSVKDFDEKICINFILEKLKGSFPPNMPKTNLPIKSTTDNIFMMYFYKVHIMFYRQMIGGFADILSLVKDIDFCDYLYEFMKNDQTFLKEQSFILRLHIQKNYKLFSEQNFGLINFLKEKDCLKHFEDEKSVNDDNVKKQLNDLISSYLEKYPLIWLFYDDQVIKNMTIDENIAIDPDTSLENVLNNYLKTNHDYEIIEHSKNEKKYKQFTGNKLRKKITESRQKFFEKNSCAEYLLLKKMIESSDENKSDINTIKENEEVKKNIEPKEDISHTKKNEYIKTQSEEDEKKIQIKAPNGGWSIADRKRHLESNSWKKFLNQIFENNQKNKSQDYFEIDKKDFDKIVQHNKIIKNNKELLSDILFKTNEMVGKIDYNKIKNLFASIGYEICEDTSSSHFYVKTIIGKKTIVTNHGQEYGYKNLSNIRDILSIIMNEYLTNIN